MDAHRHQGQDARDRRRQDGPNFPELARHVADTIPNCRLVLLPNIGHVLQLEAPDVFHRELVNFLKDDPTSDAAKQ